jgi:hypothetical protein
MVDAFVVNARDGEKSSAEKRIGSEGGGGIGGGGSGQAAAELSEALLKSPYGQLLGDAAMPPARYRRYGAGVPMPPRGRGAGRGQRCKLRDCSTGSGREHAAALWRVEYVRIKNDIVLTKGPEARLTQEFVEWAASTRCFMYRGLGMTAENCPEWIRSSTDNIQT